MARTKELLKALRSIWGEEGEAEKSELRATVPIPNPAEPASHKLITAAPWPMELPASRPAEPASPTRSAEPAEEPAQATSQLDLQGQPGTQDASCHDVEHLAGRAGVSLYEEDGQVASKPTEALLSLVDRYLHAAHYRTRHVALTWPASLRTAGLIHVFATLERWQDGDKQGVRGLLYPVKTNAFHVLNHVHLDREDVLRHARNLVEGVPGIDEAHIKRRIRDKDAYCLALANLKPEAKELFNPTVGELLPHFLAGTDFRAWTSCESRLLAHLKAKLERRRQARALGMNCAVIGDPSQAPDALFAIDGRLDVDLLRRALMDLKARGAPEVVLVTANRQVREDLGTWKGRLARFCMLLEEVFTARPPGVLVITDQPRVAFDLRQELLEKNRQREKHLQWKTDTEYEVVGIPCAFGEEGLLPPGSEEPPKPVPRELRIDLVDSEVAKVINRLWNVAYKTEGGPDNAQPVKDAAAFLGRIASLPCGLSHLARRLSTHDYTDRTRLSFDWMMYEGALREWDKSGACPEGRATLLESIQKSQELVTKYHNATPFAHLVATHVGRAAQHGRRVTIVFATPFQHLLAEPFLEGYDGFPQGTAYEAFKERVALITCANIENALANLGHGELVFAGLNDEALRVLMTDNRVPAHTSVLLTQASAQFLRANLIRIRDHVPGLKQYGARIDSILRRLADLPEPRGPLGTSMTPPPFRLELASEVTDSKEIDPATCWTVRLQNGIAQYRVDGEHLVYVYDPVSQRATERGFRSAKVASLEPGDKLFVMTPELRDMVEDALAAAGIPHQSDKTYEASLRDYHERVLKALGSRFHAPSLTAQMRALRAAMEQANPEAAKNLPREETIRHWIDLGASAKTEFEKLRPQAPGKEANFKLFAEALGFSNLEAAIFWHSVIQPVRNTRRQDSRHLGDFYSYLLLQPESAIVSANLTRQTVQSLFDKARESVVVVLAVDPPKKAAQ